MNRLKKISLTILGFFMPGIALAQGLIPQPPALLSGGTLGNSNLKFTDLALYFINLALLIIGIIAVAFIIYGGFRYITSAGNDEIAEGAKKTIQNAIIGLVIAILSYVIVTVISNALLGNV